MTEYTKQESSLLQRPNECTIYQNVCGALHRASWAASEKLQLAQRCGGLTVKLRMPLLTGPGTKYIASKFGRHRAQRRASAPSHRSATPAVAARV